MKQTLKKVAAGATLAVTMAVGGTALATAAGAAEKAPTSYTFTGKHPKAQARAAIERFGCANELYISTKKGVRSVTVKGCTVGVATTTVATTTVAPAPAKPAALMPDTVCMNLQDAQDLIQEHGVFYSRSEDATGQGRIQVLDSGWTVVSQRPAPGTPIGEGDAVLSVVRNSEPNDCK